jgi:hypothetical protein
VDGHGNLFYLFAFSKRITHLSRGAIVETTWNYQDRRNPQQILDYPTDDPHGRGQEVVEIPNR